MGIVDVKNIQKNYSFILWFNAYVLSFVTYHVTNLVILTTNDVLHVVTFKNIF